MSKSIVGIAKNRTQLESAISDLQTSGVPTQDISLLMPDSGDQTEIGTVKSTKLPEGASAGALGGGVVGGTLGLLAGIGALAIPGVGPFIAAGPIMAALGGAALGASAGGVAGALVGLGIPELEAKAYQDRLKAGGYLVAVHVSDDKKSGDIRELLKRHGLEDVSTVSEK